MDFRKVVVNPDGLKALQAKAGVGQKLFCRDEIATICVFGGTNPALDRFIVLCELGVADGTVVEPGNDPFCVRGFTGFEGGTTFVHPVPNEGGPDLDRSCFPRIQALGDQQFRPCRFGVVRAEKALRTIQIGVRHLAGEANGLAVPLLDERRQ